MSQAGNRLQGDVSLKSNTIMMDTLAKGQGQKAQAPPQPKRPAPALPPPVSNKRPKQNPQPTGRGGGNNKGRGQFCGAKGSDVRTPACMKAPKVPPLLVRASDQSPEKISAGYQNSRGLGSCTSYNGGTRSPL